LISQHLNMIQEKVRRLERRHFIKGFVYGILAVLATLLIVFVSRGVSAGSSTRVDRVIDTNFSTFAVSGGQVSTNSTVSELSLASNSTSREFISSAKEFEFPANALAVEWEQLKPLGTESRVEIQTSADGSTWSAWTEPRFVDAFLGVMGKNSSAWEAVSSDLVILDSPAKYAKYKINLTSNDATISPKIRNVQLVAIDSAQTSLASNLIDIFGIFGQAKAADVSGPRVISRSEWGADESLMTWPAQYWDGTNYTSDATKAKVNKVVIHHTAGQNNPPDPAASMRAIYRYHAAEVQWTENGQTKQGWGDIGYNFVVDQFGNIYEGREGQNGVVGAHATGANTGSIGISLMGNFSIDGMFPSDSAKDGTSSLIAWKSFINKSGQNILQTVGHRDVGRTECPGNNFYPLLSSVRDSAQAKLSSLAGPESLRVTSFSISPKSANWSEKVTVAYTVKNLGYFDLLIDKLGVAARYNTSENRDFGYENSVTIKKGESKTISFEKKIEELGNYSAWAAMLYQGKWYQVLGEKPEVLTKDNFSASMPVVKITKSLSFSNDKPVEGEELTASFTVHNYSDQPAYFKALGVAARFSGQNVDFPWEEKTIPANADLEISVKKVFAQVGNYGFFISGLTTSWGAPPVASQDILTAKSLTFSGFDYSKLILSAPTSVSPSGDLFINQDASITLKIKNTATAPVTLARLGVAARLNDMQTNRDFGYDSDVLIAAGQEISLTKIKKMTESGTYTIWPTFMAKNNLWYNPVYTGSAMQISNQLKIRVYASPADVKITASLAVSNQTAYKGEEITATFTLHNFGEQPFKYNLLGVAARLNGQNRDYVWSPDITVEGYSDYVFSQKKIFNEIGTYNLFISSNKDGKWAGIPLAAGVASVLNFTVSDFDYSKLTVESSISASPAEAPVPKEVTASYSIKNTTNVPVTLTLLGVAARLGNLNRDFGYDSIVSLGAGETLAVSKKATLTEAGTYNIWAAFRAENGRWYAASPKNSDIKNSLSFSMFANDADVRMTSSLAISPNPATISQEVTAEFKVKNFGGSAAVYNALGVAARLNGGNYDFAWPARTIEAGEEKTISVKKTFTSTGNYSAFVSSYKDGRWAALPLASGVADTANFSVAPFDYGSLKVSTALAISPSAPALNDNVTATFSLKNTSASAVTLRALGVALRLGNSNLNRDFPWQANITLAAGETKDISVSKQITEAGNYFAFISFLSQNAGWYNPAGLAGEATTANFTINVSQPPTPTPTPTSPAPTPTPTAPPSGPTATFTGNGQYQIQTSTGSVLITKNAGEVTSVVYSGGTYYVSAPSFSTSTTSFIKLVPVGSTILQVTSYHDIPSWNTSLDDNKFRGALEFRYSSYSSKVWVVNEVLMEDALKGMAETGSSAPYEHIKTMTVAGRSYYYWHYTHGGKYTSAEIFQIKNSRNGNGDDQTYKGYGLETRFPQLVQAVADTQNEVVTYNGSVAITTYFSQTDGRTRSAQEVWGINYWPWLQSKSDPDCNGKTLLGHGVGLSGYGSVQRAARGDTYRQILGYYYDSTTIGTFDMSNVKMRISIYAP